MNIKDSINAEMWTKQQYVGDDERCDHNDSIDRIQEAVGEYTKGLEKRIAELEQSYAAGLEAKCPHTLRRAVIDSLNERITTLEKALETLMDDYQYNVCFDYNYAAARKVLKGEEK
jgi:polyhydroxyalkanoate synthesis regulator phasin